MKRMIAAIMALCMVFAFAACEADAPAYADGTYTAQADAFSETSGWKDVVTLTISGGQITAVDWNPINAEGDTKKAQSESGEYGMVARGGAISEWHEQAAIMESKLIETQDPAKIKTDAAGKADGITGVTITVSSFVTLSERALAQAK